MCKLLSQKLVWESRRRAKELGVAHTITWEDVLVPEFCPALGIKLEVNPTGVGFHDASPSIDRIKPENGYVPGNVVVISFRANRIKHNATVEELKAVSSWLERISSE